MKSSSTDHELLDLERALTTTPEDVLALRRVRALPKLNLASYLEFLKSFEAPPPELLRRRKGPAGSRPFTLDKQKTCACQ